MKTHFGIIAALCVTLAGCNSGTDGPFLTDTNQALGCRGHDATCSASEEDDDSARNGASSSHPDAGSGATATSDAGAEPCRERADSGSGEPCERHGGETRCEVEHDSRGPGSGDDDEDHGGDDDRRGDHHSLADAGSANPCDDDRSGSSSGRH